MEDRRCRKVMALILTTVIILSVSVQNASAVSEKSTERLCSRVNDFKEMIIDLTSTEENQVLKIIISKVSGFKEKELAYQESLENNIEFIIEQLPLEEVPRTDISKVENCDSEKAGSEANNSPNDKPKAGDVANPAETPDVSRSTAPEELRDDLEILARIIYAEARGESFEGQVAVGAVVLNRVQHPDFPKSIEEVIYQPGQFTAVEDRQIELTPDNRAYQAAQAALEGQDPSEGAIYYYNPRIATDRWIRTRSIIRSIGNHKFCV